MRKGTTFLLLASLISGDALAKSAMPESKNAHLTVVLTGPTVIPSGRSLDLQIDVILRNETIQPIEISVSPGVAELSGIDVQVQGPHGTPPLLVYGLALRGKADIASNMAAGSVSRMQADLVPGEELHVASDIGKIYDMSVPGMYVIEARRYLAGGGVTQSNPITVTVTN